MAAEVHHLLARLSALPDHNGRWEILNQFEKTADARTVLRAVRRHGPGRLRAAALDALAYLDGEAGLDPADAAAVERLIRIRRRTDPVRPVMSIGTTWWCIRGMDQATVLGSLGLTAPRPVTCALACSVMEHFDEDEDCGHVYVGPQVNGWTSLVGPWCDAFDGARTAEVRSTVERLSADGGEAHAFYFSAYGDGKAWLVARDGVTVRRYNSLDLADATGDPLPIEQDWMAAHGMRGRPEEHLTYNEHGVLLGIGGFEEAMWEFLDANDVAAAISVDVGWRHPVDAVVHGGPLLAAVPGGTVSFPPAIYEI